MDPDSTPKTRNGLLEALVHVSRHHGRPANPAEILKGLPVHSDGVTLASAPEAADRIGLRLHLEQRELVDVPVVTLPVIAIFDDEPALVVKAIDRKRGTADFVVPSVSDDVRTLDLAALERAKAAVVVFAAPVAAVPSGQVSGHRHRHWFWSAVWKMWPNYLQVVVAAFLGNLLGLASPLFIMNVYDRVIPNLAIPTLWVLASGVTLALLFDFLLKVLRMRIVDETGRRVDMAVAGRVFDHLLMMRLAERPASTGATANRIRDLDTVRDALTSSTVVAATDMLFIGIFLWVMWLLVGPLALVPALAVPVLIGVTAFLQVPLTRALESSQSDAARRQSLLVEALTSLETIKVTGAESWIRRAWDRAVAAASRSTTRARYWANLAASFTAVVFQAVSVIIVVWGVFLVLEGAITVGALIAANILAGRVLSPLNNIAQTLSRILHARTALRGLEAVMGAETEENAGARQIDPAGEGNIKLQRISFNYPGSRTPALDNISFELRAGERIGLIGRVGSGKSTLVRLVAGLFQPTAGTYLFDDNDARQYSAAELRMKVGLCLQEPDLFSGTLRDNIVIGHPFASTADLEWAVQLAGVDTFASHHPDGLDMVVEERGRNLSGGQKQAVALARCLIRKPRVLCLDEPSAHMDIATERQLCERLRAITQTGISIILATHRDGPLDLVDRLLLLDKGRLLMDGPKSDVIARLKSGAQVRAETPREPPEGADATS